MLSLVPFLLAATTATPCAGANFASGNAVLLPGSELSIVVPDGWWLKPGAYAQRPELEFELPHECQGGTWSHPSLQVALLDGDERPPGLDAIARASGDDVRGDPSPTKLAGHDAVEYASTSRLIAHSLDGRSSLRPLYLRVVVVQLGDLFFECRLTEDVIGDGKYNSAPRNLCGSLAVRLDAMNYVP